MIANSRLCFIAGKLLFATAVFSGSVAIAATVIEQPFGTGALPPAAQYLPPGTTEIQGDLLFAVGGFPPNTVDMYQFSVAMPFFFSARTFSNVFNIPDPQLFLFDSLGKGVLWNNDRSISPSDTQSELLLAQYTPGTYFLAISWFGVDPVDAIGRYLFDTLGSNGGGPIGPGGANPIAGWLDTGAPVLWDDTGYEIGLRISAVPEPATFGLALVTAGVLLSARRRARRK